MTFQNLRLWIGGEIKSIEELHWFARILDADVEEIGPKLNQSVFALGGEEAAEEFASIARALHHNGFHTSLQRERGSPTRLLSPIGPLTATSPVLVYLKIRGAAP